MNKKELKEIRKQSGELGAKRRWASRYAILTELTKLYGKDYQTRFLSWPTKHLEELIRVVRSQ